MIVYKSVNYYSMIKYYDYGKDWIRIEFASGENRTYTHEKTGRFNVMKMKRYAKKGKGLDMFIQRNGELGYLPDKNLLISIGRRSTSFNDSQIVAV